MYFPTLKFFIPLVFNPRENCNIHISCGGDISSESPDITKTHFFLLLLCASEIEDESFTIPYKPARALCVDVCVKYNKYGRFKSDIQIIHI